MSFPLILHISLSFKLLIHLLSKYIKPVFLEKFGSKFKIDSAVRLLPEPDSPAIPNTSPLSKSNEISLSICFSLIYKLKFFIEKKLI